MNGGMLETGKDAFAQGRFLFFRVFPSSDTRESRPPRKTTPLREKEHGEATECTLPRIKGSREVSPVQQWCSATPCAAYVTLF